MTADQMEEARKMRYRTLAYHYGWTYDQIGAMPPDDQNDAIDAIPTHGNFSPRPGTLNFSTEEEYQRWLSERR